MKFLRRLIALVTAIIATPVALGLLWFGTGELTENRLAGVLITIAGMAVLLIVIQTGHASSGGLTLASIVVTAFGIAGLVSGTAGASFDRSSSSIVTSLPAAAVADFVTRRPATRTRPSSKSCFTAERPSPVAWTTSLSMRVPASSSAMTNVWVFMRSPLYLRGWRRCRRPSIGWRSALRRRSRRRCSSSARRSCRST